MQSNLLGLNLVYHGPRTSKLKEKLSVSLPPFPTSNKQTQYVIKQEHTNKKTFRAVAKRCLMGLSCSMHLGRLPWGKVQFLCWGGGGSVTKSNGFCVNVADVHLVFDVYPLQDLQEVIEGDSFLHLIMLHPPHADAGHHHHGPICNAVSKILLLVAISQDLFGHIFILFQGDVDIAYV